jgi:hypothetical protein
MENEKDCKVQGVRCKGRWEGKTIEDKKVKGNGE